MKTILLETCFTACFTACFSFTMDGTRQMLQMVFWLLLLIIRLF